MSQVLRPPKELYKKYSEKLSFCYTPGQSQFQDGYLGITESSVSGILELNFIPDKPIHAKQIDITLKGVEYVFWTEKHGESTKVHRHKEILIRHDLCVWRSPDNTYQQINELQLPFQFELPSHLPSSVKFGNEESKIYYSLKAIMKQESNMLKFRGSTEFIKIRCPITRYSLFPTILIPTQFSNYDDPSTISRGIGYSISLEHNVFSQLNPIIINFGLIFHKPNLKIKEVILGVKQKIKFRVKFARRRFKKYVLKSVIKGNEIKNRLDYNNEYKSSVKFEIPPRNDTKLKSVRHSIDRHYINVSHKIKFKIKFGFFGGSDITWEKDIKIENMITQDLIVIKGNEIKNRLDYNNEYKSSVKFEIPPRNDTKLKSVRHSIDRHYINVSHKIKFKIKFGFFGGSDITWEKDIKIENMITQDLM
ncbi:hypothetical protein Glove_428g48 [Diversispora epigaea]|uniref:Arrestin-like N-terminal domain-containing protein n=1 Tax=Diversispora epigaea TaxID=1348612 RepID=A0A397GTJ5_9GLOM|nr:hypothetical protein Glove_428g48 [Diversispora epigaea]